MRWRIAVSKSEMSYGTTRKAVDLSYEGPNRHLLAAAPELRDALELAKRLIRDMGRIIRALDDNHEWLEFWTNDGDYLCCEGRYECITAALATANAAE